MSALPFATPDATVPIPASATSFTDTLALGFTCSTRESWRFFLIKLDFIQNKRLIIQARESPGEDQISIEQDPQ